MKYSIKGDKLNHKGNLVRLGSYIMSLAKNYLMIVKHAVAKILGKESIVYCDTDSVVISFDKKYPADAHKVKVMEHSLIELKDKNPNSDEVK